MKSSYQPKPSPRDFFMDQNEKAYAHALTCIPGLGPQRLRRLQKHFGSFRSAWDGSNPKEFEQAGLDSKMFEQIKSARKIIDPEKLYRNLARQQIKCLADSDRDYPKLLREIYAAPVLLYIRGQWTGSDELNLAVVGTRKFTGYGAMAVQKIAGELADKSMTIVSGLALGIDALAHQVALDHHARTIAVLGSGLADRNIFPRNNYRLAQKIMEQGALVSEYPPDCPPLKQHFPVRNRLISGLCRGTLVIEAGEKSGALITAFLALEQNREVFAVPGPINAEKSAGTNMLISKGATLVRSAQDIFTCLNLPYPKETQAARKSLPQNPAEAAIYQALSAAPLWLDQLVNLTPFDVNVISSTLSIMEIKGLVKNIGSNRYQKL